MAASTTKRCGLRTRRRCAGPGARAGLVGLVGLVGRPVTVAAAALPATAPARGVADRREADRARGAVALPEDRVAGPEDRVAGPEDRVAGPEDRVARPEDRVAGRRLLSVFSNGR